MVDYTDPRWNESDSQNTSPSPNGISTGSQPSAIPAVIRAGMGAQVRSFDRINAMGLLTNSANAYSLTYDVAPADYFKGEFYSFFINATNTGAVTLNINGLGSRDLVQNDGSTLGAGDLVAGMVQTATYDGSKFRLVTQSANITASSVTATEVKATTVKAATAMTINNLPVFTTANDGAGSGLDSDLLDGQQGTWYQNRANHTGTQDPSTIAGLSGLLAAVAPTGSVIYTAAPTAPAGYLAADGSPKSRTTYADLFALIGTTYGAGDGSTTFNIPDLRGEFIRGLDSGRGVDSGRTLGSAQTGQNLAHTHTATIAADGGHTHTGSTSTAGAHTHTVPNVAVHSGSIGLYSEANGGAWGTASTSSAGDHSHTLSIAAVADHTHGITINSNGGTEARPRNVALLACIKT